MSKKTNNTPAVTPSSPDTEPGQTEQGPQLTSPYKFVFIIFGIAAILIGLAKFMKGC
jgi:hypothetical protein